MRIIVLTGLPGGLVVENLSANAGHKGLVLIRKIPHVMEELNLCATTPEPVLR